jgi:hypothetical protein
MENILYVVGGLVLLGGTGIVINLNVAAAAKAKQKQLLDQQEAV